MEWTSCFYHRMLDKAEHSREVEALLEKLRNATSGDE